ncbi:unnamed protein product [Notodromas monacha]|uniref:Protein kinase domain-containing protein n=1 Tax=Notodromas monacha TaxID=399045 RepID=A0A7R9GDI4_9CRUS|nr:unnamed protein product [Notodromas monacha]CAG0917237.1 unnamed protein product [Notodromas monacha]
MHGLINFQDGRLGIVMELADKGPLSRKLMRELSKGDGAAARRFSKGIINGLQYLHHRRIVHRDLKPDNILCFGELPSPKITDFGISKGINATMQLMETVIGTPRYMAPEILLSERPKYTKAVDIYSLSLILFELFTGGMDAFKEFRSLAELLRLKSQPHVRFPENFEEGLEKILDRGCSPTPTNRPTLTEILLAVIAPAQKLEIPSVKKSEKKTIGLRQSFIRHPKHEEDKKLRAQNPQQSSNHQRQQQPGPAPLPKVEPEKVPLNPRPRLMIDRKRLEPLGPRPLLQKPLGKSVDNKKVLQPPASQRARKP